ncbi:MAG: hypothetical protein K6E36_03995 [Oscillospiraceae bacterium]|nr:hypothetical protein [Oscillospiraceae bacterium]
MKKFALAGAVCGILAGIGILIAAILDEKFPKPMWFVIGALTLTAGIANIWAYRKVNRK